MTSMILDGQARFGCSLLDFYQQPIIAGRLARLGVLAVPTLDAVADAAPPAYAEVNPYDGMARWIAHCPDCRVSAEYVWVATPIMLCVTCGNRAIEGQWRRVMLPPNRTAIERSLLERPDWSMRAWVPGETLRVVKADTAKVRAESEVT